MFAGTGIFKSGRWFTSCIPFIILKNRKKALDEKGAKAAVTQKVAV